MAKANLYVSTSLSESFPLVINEAKALGIPVITNNFGSAVESVEDGVDGFVVSLENNALCDKILSILLKQVELPARDVKHVFADKNQRIISDVYSII